MHPQFDSFLFTETIEQMLQVGGHEVKSKALKFMEVCPGRRMKGILERYQSDSDEDLQKAIALSLAEVPQDEVVEVDVRRVKALYDFSGIEDGDLSFRKGEIITVLGAVYKDWWRGTLNGKTGIFPINYVEAVEAQEECKVCFEEGADYCLVPCGHTGFCGKCAEKLKECPFCKKEVKQGMKLFKM